MAGCERRGGLKPHYLWSILNHFPMPGISSMAKLDPGNYFRQDLAGLRFDLWWVLFSIKEAQRGDLIGAMSYVMCQNVTCPAPPVSFGGTIGKGSRCAPVTLWHKWLWGPLHPSVYQAVPWSVYHFAFLVHILYIATCLPHFEIIQNFWVWLFFSGVVVKSHFMYL